MSDLRWPGALGIGVAQAIALAPGVSRSGITMVTGLFLGLDRESAARYSFLLSVPVIGGAAVYKASSARQERHAAAHGGALRGGHGRRRRQRPGRHLVRAQLPAHAHLHLFVVYRLVVASALLIVIATGFRHATGI